VVKKLLLGLLLLAVLGLGGGLWWAYRSMDALVASAIRSYGPDITGVTVKLGGVKIVPAEGTAALQGLALGSPKGFKAPHVVVLDDVRMVLDVSSLTSDVVVIKEMTISKPDIFYEKGPGGLTNIDAILRNVDAYTANHLGSGKDASGAAGKAPGRKLVIDHVYIRGAKASLMHPLLGSSSMSVTLPDLHLTGIGRKSNGATADEVTHQILGALSQSLSRSFSSGVMDKLKGLFGK
jgi:hypothetical protein